MAVNRPCHASQRLNREATADAMGAKGYITAQDAAADVGVSLPTLYRWLRAEKFQGVKTGLKTRPNVWVEKKSFEQFKASYLQAEKI